MQFSDNLEGNAKHCETSELCLRNFKEFKLSFPPFLAFWWEFFESPSSSFISQYYCFHVFLLKSIVPLQTYVTNQWSSHIFSYFSTCIPCMFSVSLLSDFKNIYIKLRKSKRWKHKIKLAMK